MVDESIRALIRERPFIDNTAEGFENSAWFNLPTWDIPRWAATSKSIGRSSAERFNLVELLGDLGFDGGKSEQALLADVQWSRSSIERHGFRPLQKSTVFISDPAKGNGPAAWLSDRQLWQEIIRDWYAPNPWMTSGTVSVPLALPEIRIGERLRLTAPTEDDDETFYVEGVSLEFSSSDSPTSPPRGSTSLTLTRGLRGNDGAQLKAVRAAIREWESARPGESS